MFQQDEKAQVRRRQAERAVQLAMESRWEEAAAANKSILSLFPNDADAHNRLGRALMEQERYNEAKKAYKKALELDATNQIARKNLQRLDALAKGNGGQKGAAKKTATKVDPALFVEAIGKSTVTVLRRTASKALPILNAGDRVELLPQGKTLAVETADKEFLGAVEPKLGLRLIKLIEGGNQYAAAVTSLDEEECRILIKETYQDPSQVGRPSFPTTVVGERTRPYTKERLVRQTGEGGDKEPQDGSEADGNEGEDWEQESVRRPGDVSLSQAAAAEDADDELED